MMRQKRASNNVLLVRLPMLRRFREEAFAGSMPSKASFRAFG